MERTGRSRPRSARLLLTPGAIVLLFGAIVAAFLLRNVFVAGRHPIGWAVAAAVLAAAIEPLVSYLSRFMRRGLALLCVLVPLFVAVFLVVRGVYQDLDHSITSLQRALPQAADRLEASNRFGRVARQLDLHQRAVEIAGKLRKPSASVAGRAQSSGGPFLVTTILTVFALAWGPRFGAGALKQISDDARRDHVARVFGAAFKRSQAYLDVALAQAVLVGVVAWITFRLADVPAPTPLALVVAVMSTVPVLGIMVGYVPGVMLAAAFESYDRAGVLLLIALLGQTAQILLFRSLTKRTLYVGPGIMVIAFLIGFDIYSTGGAVFGTAIAVFGIALSDAFADEYRQDDLRPDDADPLESTVTDTDSPDEADPDDEAAAASPA